MSLMFDSTTVADIPASGMASPPAPVAEPAADVTPAVVEPPAPAADPAAPPVA